MPHDRMVEDGNVLNRANGFSGTILQLRIETDREVEKTSL